MVDDTLDVFGLTLLVTCDLTRFYFLPNEERIHLGCAVCLSVSQSVSQRVCLSVPVNILATDSVSFPTPARYQKFCFLPGFFARETGNNA